MKNHIRPYCSIFILLALLTSCKKFIEIPPSPQLVSTEAIFTNDNTATAAVDGVYTSMRAASPSFANGVLSIYCALSADEVYNTSANSAYDPFFKNAIPSKNSTIQNQFWSTPYNTIYRTNAILQGLATATDVTDAVRNQLTGEMKVVRALTYFNLTNIYGDAPLVLTSDYDINAKTPRTATTAIYQQILADLKSAQNLLSDSYPSTGKSRPNRETATALLARAYLYQKDWAGAEAQSTQVISSNLYQLVSDLNSAFLINNSETIWEIASPSESRNTAEAAAFVPLSATAKPSLAISPGLLNAFENGDKRKLNWLKSNTAGGITYYYPYKYKKPGFAPVFEYEIVLRLAEQYLIRAEARAQQGNITGAVSDLNIIRARARNLPTDLPPYSPLISQADCLTKVFHERQVELFTEWGHRWFDLKRSGTINATLAAVKTSWLPYEELYPIPYQEIQYNPFLIQNQGYN
jgi:hypothetical protein